MYRCGQCGALRDQNDVVFASESDFRGILRNDETAKPVHARRVHQCGFLAIRCKAHPCAEVLANGAVRKHLARLVASGEYVYEP